MWRRLLAFAGPAYLVSVGYMDPGNWATDLEGGAKFGYRLLWVLVMSNAMAIFLQTLSARLGVVSGRDLAQACRDSYPKPVSHALWFLCEIAIAACDLAEVLGAAIGLNLLLQIPLLAGILLTAGDTLLLLWLQQFRIRSLELIVVRLIVIIGACLGMEVFLAGPEAARAIAGLMPRLDSSSLFATIAILGATVMPHNLYLHSALVQSRRLGSSKEAKRKACRYNFVDTLVALNGAMMVNVAILVLAASVFFKRGIQVTEIQQATQLLEPLLGTRAASVIFAIALLCAGQASTLTGTMAGQIVMEGFLNFRMTAWMRRLLTRLVAIVPAAVIVYLAGDKGAYELLLLTQAVLSLQLPFAVVPLIRFTGDKGRMAEFASSVWVQVLAWLLAGINLLLNLWLARLKLAEWLQFEGVYGKAIGAAIVILIASLVLLLLYVAFARLRPWKPLGDAPATEQDSIMFVDRVAADQQAIERLDVLMAHLHGIAYIKDQAGRYVYCGGASSAALGLDPENLLSKSDEELWPGELANACRKNDQLVLKTLQRFEGIETIPQAGTPHSWLMYKFPIIERASQAVFLGCVGIDITDRKRSEEQLRGLASRLQEIREQERALTSREIHDIGQLLTALNVHLQMIGQRLTAGADPASLTVSLGAAADILTSTISSSERIARQLRPSILDNLGLTVAIRWHAREVAARSGMNLTMDRLDEVSLEPGVSIVVFRLFQGILANVEHRSEATEIEISLQQLGNAASLHVHDNGDRGGRKQTADPDTLGELEMRELTLLFGGRVSIEEPPNGGTSVCVEVPCTVSGGKPINHTSADS